MTLRLFFGAVSLSFLIFACSVQAPTESTGAGDDGQTSESDIARGALCRPCARSEQCGASSACAQYAGSDYCARACESASSCGRGEACAELTTLEGQKVKGCVSASGACGSPSSCGKCQSGRCDLITGMCESAVAADLTGPAPRPSLSAPRGVVGAAGGTVTRMYFAVIGDTRPAMLDNTSGYPIGLINAMYSQMQQLNPRPQFVISTGDYINADPFFSQARKQLAYYGSAMSQFSGPVFAAMGNHECTSISGLNCGGHVTHSMNAYLDELVRPLGKDLPYYSIPIAAPDRSWTAKVLITACNAWTDAQRAWLEAELARPTTYTILARHQPRGGPCVNDIDALLAVYPYSLLLMGHIHTYAHADKWLVVGTGGAPLQSDVPFGYVTVEQLESGDLQVKQYDATTALPVGAFTLPQR